MSDAEYWPPPRSFVPAPDIHAGDDLQVTTETTAPYYDGRTRLAVPLKGAGDRLVATLILTDHALAELHRALDAHVVEVTL